MPDHEAARAQLESALANMQVVQKIPEVDDFEVGTVIRWTTQSKHREPYYHVAVKVADLTYPNATNWEMGRYSRGLTYQYLVTHMAVADLVKIETAAKWNDITIKPVPHIEILEKISPSDSDYVLLDTSRNLTWKRVGNEWVLQDEF